MNFKKLVQIVNYVLQKYDYKLNYTKLIKLLYIADRESLSRWNFAISGDTYCSMPHGPVLSCLYNCIKGEAPLEEQSQWDNFFYKEKYDLLSRFKKDFSYGEMSDAEKMILNEIDKKYHNVSYEKLIDVAHEFQEWDSDAKERNTSFPLDKRTILKALGRSDDETREILETDRMIEECEQKLKE